MLDIVVCVGQAKLGVVSMGIEIIRVYDHEVVVYEVQPFCVIFHEKGFLVWESRSW